MDKYNNRLQKKAKKAKTQEAAEERSGKTIVARVTTTSTLLTENTSAWIYVFSAAIFIPVEAISQIPRWLRGSHRIVKERMWKTRSPPKWKSETQRNVRTNATAIVNIYPVKRIVF